MIDEKERPTTDDKKRPTTRIIRARAAHRVRVGAATDAALSQNGYGGVFETHLCSAGLPGLPEGSRCKNKRDTALHHGTPSRNAEGTVVGPDEVALSRSSRSTATSIGLVIFKGSMQEWPKLKFPRAG